MATRCCHRACADVHRMLGSCSKAAQQLVSSHGLDGDAVSMHPLQVIDYGLTKLDDHYSWATGWVETQLAEQRLRSSASVSSSQLERAAASDSDIVAAATDPTASQRLAARQARKLQRKWNKPSGFEWYGSPPWPRPYA